MNRFELTTNRKRFILTLMTPNGHYPQTVAAELRAEMARQLKTVADLAEALGLERQAAKKRYDGEKSLTVTEVDMAAAWLGIDRLRLLVGAEQVAS